MIDEYLGDRITHAQADKRYEDHDENDNHTFLFIVDKKTVIDAGVGGNDARFINHKCDPNCESEIKKGRVFIVATKAIAQGRGARLRLPDRPREGRSGERRRDLCLPLRLAEVPRHDAVAGQAARRRRSAARRRRSGAAGKSAKNAAAKRSEDDARWPQEREEVTGEARARRGATPARTASAAVT